MTYFQWEMDLLQAIQNIHHDFLDGVMWFLSTIINHGEFWIAVGVLLVIFPKTRKCGLILLLAMLLESLMIDKFLKPLFARPRPCSYTEYMDLHQIELIIRMKESDMLRSFPSGHTACSFAAAVSIAKHDRKFGVAALILASLMAFSRMYLFVHFPTDVLMGAVIGTMSAFASYYIVNEVHAWMRKKASKTID